MCAEIQLKRGGRNTIFCPTFCLVVSGVWLIERLINESKVFTWNIWHGPLSSKCCFWHVNALLKTFNFSNWNLSISISKLPKWDLLYNPIKNYRNRLSTLEMHFHHQLFHRFQEYFHNLSRNSSKYVFVVHEEGLHVSVITY